MRAFDADRVFAGTKKRADVVGTYGDVVLVEGLHRFEAMSGVNLDAVHMELEETQSDTRDDGRLGNGRRDRRPEANAVAVLVSKGDALVEGATHLVDRISGVSVPFRNIGWERLIVSRYPGHAYSPSKVTPRMAALTPLHPRMWTRSTGIDGFHGLSSGKT